MNFRFVSTLFAAAAFVLAACTPPAPTREAPADALARLESHYRLFKPAGEGPHKTILFFHSGSDLAWYPAQQTYVENIVAHGYAVVFVEPPLDNLKNMFVLPTGNPALLARGALIFDGADMAGGRPVAV